MCVRNLELNSVRFILCNSKKWWSRCKWTVTNAQEWPWRLPAKQMVSINHERERERERERRYLQCSLILQVWTRWQYIEGSDRDQLVVIGEGVDSAKLTCSLRKKLCYSALWSVDEVKAKPKPEEKPKPEVQKPNKPNSTSSTCSCGCPQLPICPQYAPYPMLYEARVYDYTSSPSYCPIMWYPTFSKICFGQNS